MYMHMYMFIFVHFTVYELAEARAGDGAAARCGGRGAHIPHTGCSIVLGTSYKTGPVPDRCVLCTHASKRGCISGRHPIGEPKVKPTWRASAHPPTSRVALAVA